MTLTPAQAQIRVFTFKEGVLSPIAHDLQLSATAFTIDIEPDSGTVRAIVRSDGLRVLGVMAASGLDTSILTRADREKIERNVVEKVLDSRRFPEVRFEGKREDGPAGGVLAGTLSLHGHSRPIAMRLQNAADRLVAEVVLHQPDFGITPYSAMLGALRLQADVRVRVEVPAMA